MFNRVTRLSAIGALLATAGLLLAGCTMAPLASDYSLEGKGNTGVVFLSLTRTGSIEHSIWLKLRGVGHDYSSYVALDDYGVTWDWAKLTFSGAINDFGKATKQDPVGHLAVFALPAGDYEFYSWYGGSPIWLKHGDDYDVRSRPFSVKFTVRPGQVTYAGNLQIEMPDRIFADYYKQEYEISVADKLERDQAVLRQKYPRLAGQSVSTSLMTTSDAGQRLTFYAFPSTGPTRNGGNSFN